MKKLTERKEAWFRIIVAIVSGIILYCWRILIGVLAIVNWFIVIFSGKRHQEIAEFSEYFNTENYKFMRYLTFVSNERPFPFSNLEKISSFKKN
jgi:hypothetical protein